MDDLKFLSVIVPVFDEIHFAPILLEKVLRQGCGQVIVVDDGSTDGTEKFLRSWANEHQVRLVVHEENRGKGAAIRSAIRFIELPYAIIQDADLEYDPNDYGQVLQPLLDSKADVVFGSRYSGIRFPGFRQFETWEAVIGFWAVSILNCFVRFLYGIKTSDEATCYKAFRSDILREFDLRCDGFEFCPEVVAKTARSRLRFEEVSIRYNRRHKADGKKIRCRDLWTAIATLWRYRNWRPSTMPETTNRTSATPSGRRRLGARSDPSRSRTKV